MIKASKPRPIRVAQVVHGLVPGGIETWLVNVLRQIDRERFRIDFITSNPQPCFYDDTVRRLGARIICCPRPKRLWQFAPDLYRNLVRRGPYDVLHSHVDHFGGIVLRIAKAAGVPLRIAHSHSDTSGKQQRAGRMRRFYLQTAKRSLRKCATQGLAVSEQAGASLFPDWGDDDRWRVVRCGIETDKFRSPVDRAAQRRELGIPADAVVLGHMGAFREPKNHRFLVEIAAAAMARNPQAWLVMTSDGPLRSEIAEQVNQLGIADRVVFTGIVDDPVAVMRGTFDVFVFPSLWEGLPLAVVEAQAAGMPAVISDVIDPSVVLVPKLVDRLSLAQSAAQWADVVLKAACEPRRCAADRALDEIESSEFSIRNSVRALEQIYAGC